MDVALEPQALAGRGELWLGLGKGRMAGTTVIGGLVGHDALYFGASKVCKWEYGLRGDGWVG